MTVDYQKTAAVIVSGVVCLAFAMVLYLMLTHAVGTPDNDVLKILVGVLGSKFGTVVDYHVGSSASSRAKDETIGKLSAPDQKA